MTSSNRNIFRVTGPLCGEFTGPGEFPTQRPVTQSFYVFFDLCLNKRLSKRSWGRWFETLSWSLWRHSNGLRVAGNWYSPFLFAVNINCDMNYYQLIRETTTYLSRLPWIHPGTPLKVNGVSGNIPGNMTNQRLWVWRQNPKGRLGDHRTTIGPARSPHHNDPRRNQWW